MVSTKNQSAHRFASTAWFALLVLALACAACGSDPTALIVRIDTNIPLRTSLLDFSISVQRDGASAPFYSHTYDLASGRYTLPASVAVIPRLVTDTHPVTVVVSGNVAGGAAVSQSARVDIAAGHVEYLDMFLAIECVGADAQHLCGPTQTCDLGRCVDVYRPSLPFREPDAHVSDAHPSDSVADTLPPTDAPVDTLADVSIDVLDAGDVSSVVDASDAIDGSADVGDAVDAFDAVGAVDAVDAVVADTGCDGGSCGCGADTQPCCAGSVCASALSCVAGTCHTCGGAGLTCCPGSMCSAGYQCYAGTCRCGILNTICCAGGTCGSSLICSSGMCVRCGVASEPCCVGGVCMTVGETCGTVSGVSQCCVARSAPCATGLTSCCDGSTCQPASGGSYCL
jgi:hypothetical protein